MPTDRARVVQLSDTHLSATAGVPPSWSTLLDLLRADPPDLVVHTGDIVFEDPDDDADRAFAKRLIDALPAPVVLIPGNHDVGSYDEAERRAARIDAFREVWGHDRFCHDLAGWRLVGVDAYLLGEAEHDQWFEQALDCDGPVVVFVHQPVRGDREDGWHMPPTARRAFDAVVAGADVRVVASGHRHRSHRVGATAWWAPSLTIPGLEHDTVGDPRLGFLEHVIAADGSHSARVVHTDGVDARGGRRADSV